VILKCEVSRERSADTPISEAAVIVDAATTDHEHHHGGFPEHETRARLFAFFPAFTFDHSSSFKRAAVPQVWWSEFRCRTRMSEGTAIILAQVVISTFREFSKRSSITVRVYG
jgi:hypothetical protein